jgi:hypothetical protein
MSHDRCLACGVELSGASRCPKCARPKPMLLLDLQSTAVPNGPRPQIVQRDSRARLGAVGLVGVLVVALVIGAVARVTGGRGDRVSTPETSDPTSATSEPAEPESTVPATTVPVVTTTLLPEAASVTTRSLSVPPTAATIAYVNGRMGAVFGEKVAFRLYAFDGNALRGYVDTATGQLVNAATSVPADQVFAGSDTRVFVLNSRTQTLSTIDRNLREMPVTIAHGVESVFPSTNGRIWTVDSKRGAGNATRVAEFGADGTKNAELLIPLPFAVRGSLGGAIVTAAAGQIFVHDPKTARVSQYAVGELTAINGNRVAWLSCDASPTCHVYIGDATRPRLATVSNSTMTFDAYALLSLSPTGDAAVVPPGLRPGVRLLNFATGLDITLSLDSDDLAWSPDGKWLINTSSSPPQAIDVPAGRSLDLSLAGPDHAPFRVVPV